MFKPLAEPRKVSDGLLIEVVSGRNSRSPEAWVLQRNDGYYYKLFLRPDSPIQGPFNTIEAVRLACQIDSPISNGG